MRCCAGLQSHCSCTLACIQHATWLLAALERPASAVRRCQIFCNVGDGHVRPDLRRVVQPSGRGVRTRCQCRMLLCLAEHAHAGVYASSFCTVIVPRMFDVDMVVLQSWRAVLYQASSCRLMACVQSGTRFCALFNHSVFSPVKLSVFFFLQCLPLQPACCKLCIRCDHHLALSLCAMRGPMCTPTCQCCLERS